MRKVAQISFSRRTYIKVALLFTVFFFLFLNIGVNFYHNHSDAKFHNDCPACMWLSISISAFLAILILLDLILRPEIFFPLYITEIFIFTIYLTLQYLRSPPVLA